MRWLFLDQNSNYLSCFCCCSVLQLYLWDQKMLSRIKAGIKSPICLYSSQLYFSHPLILRVQRLESIPWETLEIWCHYFPDKAEVIGGKLTLFLLIWLTQRQAQPKITVKLSASNTWAFQSWQIQTCRTKNGCVVINWTPIVTVSRLLNTFFSVFSLFETGW